MALAQLKLQSTVAKKVNVRAILLEDTDPNSPLYGGNVLGHPGVPDCERKDRRREGLEMVYFRNCKRIFRKPDRSRNNAL